MQLDFDTCYRAVDSRDARFDGFFFTAVTSTGIYCRPSCPAITPKRANVTFYPSAAAAQVAGFRACRRCRPDAAVGSPLWDARADVVGRAMRLIADGVVDREGVAGLATRLGYTSRHLHRLISGELGAGPLALARANRAQTARLLIEATDLSLAEIAFAAGFGSLRQFNDTVREVFAATPSQLRLAAPVRTPGTAAVTAAAVASPVALRLRLPYREPLAATALVAFLAARTVPGVDEVCEGVYRRALRLPYGTGWAQLAIAPGYVRTDLHLVDVRDVAPAVARCRRLLDLDADPRAIDATLAEDPVLAPLVAKEPGLRVPRAVDGFEIAVRAIAGQQISVAGTRTVLTRLVTAAGAATDAGGADRPWFARLRPFPDPAAVAEAPDSAFAMPGARRRTIRQLAGAIASGDLSLDGGADREEVLARLRQIPGIGVWTAGYIAMRALGDPDAFLATDLVAGQAAARLGLPSRPRELAAHASRWRPWRSYGLLHLWCG